MMLRSVRGGVLLLAVLVSSAVLGQDTPPEPTAEQVQKAKDDFARVGATSEAVTDPLTKRVSHSFGFAFNTKDADLKNLPNPPFPFTLSLGGTKVTDAGLKELKDLKNLTTLVLSGTQVTDAGLKELQGALPNCEILK